ncbi:MAG: hypothetical protein HGA78_09805 [Nitrospirales bacterium]|nr:hypothetical protein [Nitrospirales bacterium]
MKKIAAILMGLMLSLSGAAYAGQFDPMNPGPSDEQTTLGLGYSYHPAKYKMSGDSFVKIRVNQNTYQTVVSDIGSLKTTQNLVYLQASYKIKNWQVYGRFGGADLKVNDAFVFDNVLDFKSGFKAFGTVGVRGSFPVSSVFSIGPFAEASLFASHDDSESRSYIEDFTGDGINDTLYVREKIETNPLEELNLGVSFQANLDKAIIYAGPFLYWSEAKAHEAVDAVLIDGNTGLPADSLSGSASNKWKEKGNLGGFAGFKIPLGKNIMFEAEGQLKSNFSAGGSVSYKF